MLVTGGTGSFGNAFVRRALDDGAARVAVFSRDELKQAHMRAAFANDERLRFFLGDVRDAERVRWAMAGVDIVIHAAAMKRIEACEADPLEAIDTNIDGTRNVALTAIDEGVERAVLLSTDKAPLASTLYGMTKAVAERLWIQSNVFAAGTSTKLSATRYGNVLGSRGSVLDRWRAQYAAGEPITITDERASRFWMTIEQAVDLVVLALEEMRGGEVFVPKVGSAPILDLASAVVETPLFWPATGTIAPIPYAPGHICTGLRPGERLHETLISADEAANTYDRGGHYRIEPASCSWNEDRDPQGNSALVEAGFAYTSDTNPEQFTVEELRRLIA